MSSPTRLSQAERRARTRRRLLDAAADVFARRGYAAASLDEISAAAGLTRGALHYNFAGKRELLLGLLDEHLARRTAALERADDPRDAVRRLPLDREFSLLLLEFACAAARDPALHARLRPQLDGLRRRSVPATERLLERAGVQDAPAEVLVTAFSALANGLAVEALTGADVAELEGVFDLVLALVVRGLGGTSPD